MNTRELRVALKNIQRGNMSVIVFENPDLLPLYVKNALHGARVGIDEFPEETWEVISTESFIERLKKED